MVLNKFRAAGERMLMPLAGRLAPGGADRLTWISMLMAIGAGVSFAFAGPSRPLWLVVGAVLVLGNALLDALDGIVARITASASPAGNFLDHVIDRYADLAILTGLALSGFGDPRLGLLAVTGVFLTSYMGTQAEAVGLSRDYGGVLGRADRLILLTAVPPIQAALSIAGWDVSSTVVGPFGAALSITLVGWLLAAFGVLGHITALQRFVRARHALLMKEGRRPPEGGAPERAVKATLGAGPPPPP
jgi:archaetidylinositol phosphate synthase